MKFSSLALSAVCATMVFAAPAFAQQQPAQPAAQVLDAASDTTAVTVAATVAAVDAKNRVVTLQGAEGNEFGVKVGKSVNLGAIQAGDTVDATYVRAIALDFQKGDGIRMAASTARADGADALSRITVVSNIWAINQAEGNVTVLGPFGHLSEVHLRNPAELNGVKVGDQMKITYTQAVASALVKKS